MLLTSSLPAQAASTIGSNRIAANFADVPKRKSSTCPRGYLLDRAAPKWNSQLGYRARIRPLKTAPTHGHWGSNGTWVGLIPAGAAGAMGIEPRPRLSYQPRLPCGTCLIATFG